MFTKSNAKGTNGVYAMVVIIAKLAGQFGKPAGGNHLRKCVVAKLSSPALLMDQRLALTSTTVNVAPTAIVASRRPMTAQVNLTVTVLLKKFDRSFGASS